MSLFSTYGSTSNTSDDSLDPSSSDFILSLEEKAKMFDRQDVEAMRLSQRLLNTSSVEDEERILRESLNISDHPLRGVLSSSSVSTVKPRRAKMETGVLLCLAVAFFLLLAGLIWLGIQAVGPPAQPVGPYLLVERQEGENFFDYYTFYEGRDSAGSNGFNTYVNEARAKTLGIVNITMEKDILDLNVPQRRELTSNLNATNSSLPTNESTVVKHNMTESEMEEEIKTQNTEAGGNSSDLKNEEAMIDSMPDMTKEEPFIYMSSMKTADGPREAIRLEGKRRFNRGLFILDLRHMPAGCSVWPAFWLTDEANWPINGEIDIVEGVNYQTVAKTALHSTQGCSMEDVPQGVKIGSWDTAVGIPDRKTGIPDMTMRYATDCFVYNPQQWLNQGCVAVDTEGDTIGIPLNQKGGGVYVLEWDPINRHIRSWVFSPHTKVPANLKETIRTASMPDAKDRVRPNPDTWPLPYGYFPIGDGTDCPHSHFKNMRLVFNLAFCGSVAGNRFQMDCPIQAKQFDTCNDWVTSDPEELKQAYWKIRGVYVYERQWERRWV